MNVDIVGDEQSAHAVIFKLKQWDDAISKLDISKLAPLCDENLDIFDIGYQLEGFKTYREFWDKYVPFLSGEIQVHRQKMKVFASQDLAFLSCYCKIDQTQPVRISKVKWCRVTMGFIKKNENWKVNHLHISLPADMMTMQVKPMNFAPDDL